MQTAYAVEGSLLMRRAPTAAGVTLRRADTVRE